MAEGATNGRWSSVTHWRPPAWGRGLLRCQWWSRAAPACARLLVSAPRAEKCQSRKQPVRSTSRSTVVLQLSVEQVAQAGERQWPRRDSGGAVNRDQCLRRWAPGAHPTASLWPPGWPRMGSRCSWSAWWQGGLQAEKCRGAASASGEE